MSVKLTWIVSTWHITSYTCSDVNKVLGPFDFYQGQGHGVQGQGLENSSFRTSKTEAAYNITCTLDIYYVALWRISSHYYFKFALVLILVESHLEYETSWMYRVPIVSHMQCIKLNLESLAGIALVIKLMKSCKIVQINLLQMCLIQKLNLPPIFYHRLLFFIRYFYGMLLIAWVCFWYYIRSRFLVIIFLMFFFSHFPHFLSLFRLDHIMYFWCARISQIFPISQIQIYESFFCSVRVLSQNI